MLRAKCFAKYCTVIEPFSLQYHTHVEHTSVKTINSSYDSLQFG